MCILERWLVTAPRLDWSGTGLGHCKRRCPDAEATAFFVSNDGCWPTFKSPPFLFLSDDTIPRAVVTLPTLLPKFRKPNFGKWHLTSFSRFGVRGEKSTLTRPGGLSVQDTISWPQSPLPASPRHTLRLHIWSVLSRVWIPASLQSPPAKRERMCLP